MVIKEDKDAVMWGDLLGGAGTSQLPGDLIIQILLRLRVKSILRFKSVCRAWYALFNSPMFIHGHSRMAKSFAKINTLWSLFVHTQYNKENGHIFSLLFACSSGDPVLIILNAPYEGDCADVSVVGSINGLICLNLYINGTTFVLWNPATRKHFQIQNPQLSLATEERVSVGFAYDEKTDCYKVIRILHSKDFDPILRPVRVEIYSTGTNAWRTIEVVDFPRLVNYIYCGNVVCGCPYWYAYKPSFASQVLIWFDASEDVFRFRPLPLGHSWRVKTCLGATGEQPVAFAFSYWFRIKQSDKWADIWKLNKSDDGGKDLNYVEKFTLDLISNLASIVGFWRNGDIIALDFDEELVIYDLHSAKIKYLTGCGGCWNLPEVYDYTESLVSPSRVAWLC